MPNKGPLPTDATAETRRHLEARLWRCAERLLHAARADFLQGLAGRRQVEEYMSQAGSLGGRSTQRWATRPASPAVLRKVAEYEDLLDNLAAGPARNPRWQMDQVHRAAAELVEMLEVLGDTAAIQAVHRATEQALCVIELSCVSGSIVSGLDMASHPEHASPACEAMAARPVAEGAGATGCGFRPHEPVIGEWREARVGMAR